MLLARPRLRQLYTETVWLISPKSFSDLQNGPKTAAWEAGRLPVPAVFKQGHHDHSGNKTFGTH